MSWIQKLWVNCSQNMNGLFIPMIWLDQFYLYTFAICIGQILQSHKLSWKLDPAWMNDQPKLYTLADVWLAN